jgi:hypothetical protein
LPQSPGRRSRRPIIDGALVVGCCLVGGYAAVLGFFFLPSYAGAVPLPLSALLPAALAWLLPRICFRLTGSLLAAAAPALVTFAVLLVLLVLPRSANAGMALQVGLAQWRVFVLLGAVALAGAASLGLLWGDKLAAQVRRERAGGDPRMGPDAAGGHDAVDTGTTENV